MCKSAYVTRRHEIVMEKLEKKLCISAYTHLKKRLALCVHVGTLCALCVLNTVCKGQWKLCMT